MKHRRHIGQKPVVPAYKPIPIHTPPKPASYSWIKNRN